VFCPRPISDICSMRFSGSRRIPGGSLCLPRLLLYFRRNVFDVDSSSIDTISLAALVIFQGVWETPKGLHDRSKIKCDLRILGRKFGCCLEMLESEFGPRLRVVQVRAGQVGMRIWAGWLELNSRCPRMDCFVKLLEMVVCNAQIKERAGVTFDVYTALI